MKSKVLWPAGMLLSVLVACSPETVPCFEDVDGDGFGGTVAVDTVGDCVAAGLASDTTDCDDSVAAINPDALEVAYDGADNDCDPTTLDDDLDQDGFVLAEDCDDQNDGVHPAQDEAAYDGVDNDCDPSTLDDDLDGDGFGIAEDCDDTDEDVNPAATEILNDGLDNDCDPSTTDDGCLPTTGLTSLWAFEDDTTDAMGLNDGTASNGAYVDGFAGRAFDSSEQTSPVVVPHSASLTDLSDFTVHAWIQTTQFGVVWSLYRCGGSSCNGWDLAGGSVQTDGTLRFVLRDGDVQGENDSLLGQTVVTDGQWHHIAFVRDRVNRESLVYVDGVLDGSRSTPTATRALSFTTDDPLVIGAQTCGSPSCNPDPYLGFFDGVIDELALLPSVMSATDIQAIFDAGSAGYCLP